MALEGQEDPPITDNGVPDDLEGDDVDTGLENAAAAMGENRGVGDVTIEGPVVVSELLCYAAHYLNRSPPDNIQKILLNAFTPEEIFEAKKSMWCPHNLPHLKKFQIRKTTPNRHCSEANLNDIFDAFYQLDNVADFVKVKFVAHNLVKLPTVQPEELNELSLLKKIEVLEKKFEVLESRVTLNGLQCDSIEAVSTVNKKKLMAHERLVDTFVQKQLGQHRQENSDEIVDDQADSDIGHEVHNNSIAVVDDDSDDGWVTEDSDVCDSASVAGNEDSEENEDSSEENEDSSDCGSDSEDSGRSSTDESESDGDKSDVSVISKSSSQSRDSGCRSCCENYRNTQFLQPRKFHTPRPRKYDNPVSTQNSGKRRSFDYAVSGRNKMFQDRQRRDNRVSEQRFGMQRMKSRVDSDGFSIPRQNWRKEHRNSTSLFIYNIPSACSVATVGEYVEDRNVNVIELFQRSHPDARRKSFVLQVSNKASQRLLEPSFWPSGVKVREYDMKGHRQ